MRFEQAAQDAAFLDYLAEVDHAVERIKRLEHAIDAAMLEAPGKMRAVIEGLQACWGEVFGDPLIATAILDRLLHHSTTINIKGESYRLKEKKRAGLLSRAEAHVPQEREHASEAVLS